MIMSRRRPLRRSGPSFNHAKTDPIALWINQESRHEALKHYIVREPELLKRHEELYNVRLPAHIDFTRDTVSFGGKRVEISEASCRFLSRSEMDKVAHLEWTTISRHRWGRTSLKLSTTASLSIQIWKTSSCTSSVTASKETSGRFGTAARITQKPGRLPSIYKKLDGLGKRYWSSLRNKGGKRDVYGRDLY
jgi:hypothetical protein